MIITAASAAFLSCGDGPEGNVPAAPVPALRVSVSTTTPDSVLVGYPADACIGPSGEILLLDQSAARVLVFSPGGDFVEYMGGCGEGPGEMGNPMSIETVLDRILVRDQTKHGYIVFGPGHQYLEQISLWPTGSPTNMVEAEDGKFIAQSTRIVPYGDGLGLSRLIARYSIGSDSLEAVFHSDTVPLPGGDMHALIRASEELLFTADPETGRVYTALSSTDRCQVMVFDRDGASAGSITEDLEPVEKTPSEMLMEREFMNSQLQTMGVTGISDWEPEPLRRMATGLGVDQTGRLWVQTGLGSHPEFLIYSPSGEPAGRASFPRESFRWNFRIEPQGILCWEEDPASGEFTVHVLEIETL